MKFIKAIKLFSAGEKKFLSISVLVNLVAYLFIGSWPLRVFLMGDMPGDESGIFYMVIGTPLALASILPAVLILFPIMIHFSKGKNGTLILLGTLMSNGLLTAFGLPMLLGGIVTFFRVLMILGLYKF